MNVTTAFLIANKESIENNLVICELNSLIAFSYTNSLFNILMVFSAPSLYYLHDVVFIIFCLEIIFLKFSITLDLRHGSCTFHEF